LDEGYATIAKEERGEREGRERKRRGLRGELFADRGGAL
jgi:hypothetical protein